MDMLTERAFLEILEEEKEMILSKANNKIAKNARALAWTNIKLKLEGKTGKLFEEKKLQKKWNNIQSRIKDKCRSMKKTGGGPGIKGSYNDVIAERIFGPENPKLVCVPGAMENGRKVSLNEQDEEDENEDSFSTDGTNSANAGNFTSSCTKNVRVDKPSCRLQVTTARQGNSINKEELYVEVLNLQKETLILAKEKFQLEIRGLKERQTNQTTDAATQTTMFSNSLPYLLSEEKTFYQF